MKGKILSLVVAIVVCIVLVIPANALMWFSGYGYYPETFISSPDGQITPDLESLYPVWVEGVVNTWNFDGKDSREDFLVSIENNSYLKEYYDENDTYVEKPIILSGLTLQQAADKIAKEKSREWQFIARCATQGMELTELDFLIYTMNITDASKLINGKLRITIESNRCIALMQSMALTSMVLTQNGAEIPATTFSEGQLWSEYYSDIIGEEEIQKILDEGKSGFQDSPLTAIRTYELPVDVGSTEFIIDDGINTFKLIVNVAADQPSSWAVEQVDTAIAANLVPQSLQLLYTQATTRAEFCSLAVTLYETITGNEITERVNFDDTNNINVEKAAAIGVVSGVGNNNFDPNAQLTREQAATMLSRLANAIGKPLPSQASTFADNADISSWAIESVGQVQKAEIMGGIGNNTFAPKEPYTREQSIITIMRLYDIVK